MGWGVCAVFYLCLCSISWDGGKKLWICIKQSATRRWHAWLVLLLRTTAPDKCFLHPSFSYENRSEGEDCNLMGTLFFCTLWLKTNTLMMQAHMQGGTKPWELIHKKTEIHPQPHTQNGTLTILFFKEDFRVMFSMSALLSNSFKVCC